MNGWRKQQYQAMIAVFVSGVFCCSIGGQSFETAGKNVKDAIEEIVRGRRRGEMYTVDYDRLIEDYGFSVVQESEKYLRDPNESVRFVAGGFLLAAGRQSKKVDERQRVVEKLLETRFEAGLRCTVSLPKRILRYFSSEDHSEKTKQMIEADFLSGPSRPTILLVGAAGMNSLLPQLKKLVDDVNEPVRIRSRSNKHKLAWAALRARARMGVKEDVQRCIELVESYPREHFRVSRWWWEGSYIRQPEVVEYLQKYLFSDKSVPRDVDHVGISYSVYATSALRQMLHDYPGRHDVLTVFWTEDEVEQFRTWMKDQKQKQQEAEKPEEKQWDIRR